MTDRSRYLLVASALGIGLCLILVQLAGGRDLPVALAQPGTGVVRVATSGNDAPGCGGEANPCRTAQYAVDKAFPGEEIRVASGIYTDVNGYGGLAQAIYLSKTLTIRGGYTITNWTTPDPEANPTILDALGQGRVLYITIPAPGVGISPTVEGLRFTGGDATGLGGSPEEHDAGGGVYVHGAATTISNCLVYSNTASTTSPGFGGGLSLSYSAVTLSHNTITGNTASLAQPGNGGGLILWHSDATLSHNTVAGNTASMASDGYGGGLYLFDSDGIVLNGNRVQANVASVAADGSGGGLWISESDATLEANTIVGNTAALNPTAYGWGGGLRVESGSSLTLTNNVVAGNQANSEGSGLWLNAGWGLPTTGYLLHNTIAHNATGGGSGQGVYVGSNTTLAFTNTIVAGHEGTGVFVDPDGTAALEATLWHDNGADTGGSGTVITGTVNVYGEPAFVDPTTWDYHLTADSAAIDAGLDAGVMADMDGDPRPFGAGYDIGADEYGFPGSVQLAPDRSGSAAPGTFITYTHTLTNTGNCTATFGLVYTSSQGWALVSPNWPITLAPQGKQAVWVTITIPADAISGTVDSTVVTATSQADVAVFASVVDTTTVVGELVEGWNVYLPLVLRSYDP